VGHSRAREVTRHVFSQTKFQSRRPKKSLRLASFVIREEKTETRVSFDALVLKRNHGGEPIGHEKGEMVAGTKPDDETVRETARGCGKRREATARAINFTAL